MAFHHNLPSLSQHAPGLPDRPHTQNGCVTASLMGKMKRKRATPLPTMLKASNLIVLQAEAAHGSRSNNHHI